MKSDEAKLAVLAEYRRVRHAHRPCEAMRWVRDHAATGYMFGIIAQLPPDDGMQQRDLARFRAANQYLLEIHRRDQGPNRLHPVHRFWFYGVVQHAVGATS